MFTRGFRVLCDKAGAENVCSDTRTDPFLSSDPIDKASMATFFAVVGLESDSTTADETHSEPFAMVLTIVTVVSTSCLLIASVGHEFYRVVGG